MDLSLQQKANVVRKWSLISTTEAGSGHPTSCMSAADLMTVLFEKFYTFDLHSSHNLYNDRLIFSKGHAAPLFYSLYALSGAFKTEELKKLRKFSSRLEGHPTPLFSYTEAATGSLGQGLSVGAGMAIGLQKITVLQEKPHVYVLLGDGELAEGQVWEAANFASHYKLQNLIAIVDVNRLGQSEETMFGHRVEEYAQKFRAFDWEVITIDGHNFEEIENALTQAKQNTTGKPFAIIAKTFKGKGVSFLENKDNWHGKPVPKDQLQQALDELGQLPDESVIFSLKKPEKSFIIERPTKDANADSSLQIEHHNIGDQVATREVYGKTLASLGNTNTLIYALDGDVKNSTYSMDFKAVYPDRFIECFIAEQNMVSVAVGLSKLGKHPFVSTFAAFLTRAFDQIRMARLSNATICFVGSHAGVSIGEDGASQMGLEDIAMFGTLPNTTILHPSDAVSTAKLLYSLSTHWGISYLRTLRSKTPVLYEETETFHIGGSKVLRSSENDICTIVGTGITVHEALKAYEELKKEHIFVRVVDCYSIKPIDRDTLMRCATETKQRVLITVEDHFKHGGLGDFVLSKVAKYGVTVYKLSVKTISHSGTMSELMDHAGISAKYIVDKVKAIL
jgi:transketolase